MKGLSLIKGLRKMAKNKNLWGGRFSKELDGTVKCFTYSLYIDGQLLDAEIRVNQAHAKMLGRVGLPGRSTS